MTYAAQTPSIRSIEAAMDKARDERAQALAAFFSALRKPAVPAVAQTA